MVHLTRAEGASDGSSHDQADRRTIRPTRRKRRLWPRILLPLLGLLLVALAWGGWQLWQLGSNLLGLKDVASQAQHDVRFKNFTALRSDLVQARNLASRASASADLPAVELASRLPWVGDDVTVARQLAHAANDLTAGTTSVDPLIGRLAVGGTKAVLSDPATHDVVLDVRAASAAAAQRLDGLDLSHLALPVGDDVATLRDGLAKVGPAVDTLTPYLDAVAILSTPGSSHTWFVATQNLGESRPSGGIIGAWLLVRASDGTLTVVDRGSNDALGEKVDYQGSLPAGYEEVWGDSMSDWRTVNMSANFPEDARLFAHAWNARGGKQVDGVLALGQGSVRFLAAATGPVTVKGRSIAPDQLADYLQVGIYRDYPDPKAKDAVVAEIVAQILGRLSSGQLDLPGLLASAVGGPTADYLQLWSSDNSVQKQIRAAGLSGEFTDEAGPVASVRLADAGANKLDSFMHLGAEYRLGECVADEDGIESRSSTFTVTLRNAVPGGLPDYVTGKGELLDGRKHPVGSSRDFVVVYTPAQATLTSALLDGKPAVVHSAWIGERQMLAFDVVLTPGSSATISLTWDELPTDNDNQAFPLTPRIVLPPLANPANVRVVDGSACR